MARTASPPALRLQLCNRHDSLQKSRAHRLAAQSHSGAHDMEYINLGATGLKSSRIGLGTWAIGGWMWGGTDEIQAIATIRTALDLGINLIDTAPVYGFGTAESILGKALDRDGLRSKALIATKAGLEWSSGRPRRDSRPLRLRQELEDSL